MTSRPWVFCFRPILEFAVCAHRTSLGCLNGWGRVPLHIWELAERGYQLRTVLHMELRSRYRVFHFCSRLLSGDLQLAHETLNQVQGQHTPVRRFQRNKVAKEVSESFKPEQARVGSV
jgi:hypothetical protein